MSKHKKAKLPKRIAGVKVPKSIRKSGNPLMALIESPAGRQVAAEALMAVAGVLAGGKLKEAASDFRHADSGHRGAGLGNALLGVAETAVGAMGDTVRASVQGGDHRRHERRADQGD